MELARHAKVVIRAPIINVKAFYLLSAVLEICMPVAYSGDKKKPPQAFYGQWGQQLGLKKVVYLSCFVV